MMMCISPSKKTVHHQMHLTKENQYATLTWTTAAVKTSPPVR